ncbi:ribonuclease H [Cytophagaceae bacterium AH-315-L13]|nr:ribonuclease H [Cytophagaceae bacterium AH-315-L13]
MSNLMLFTDGSVNTKSKTGYGAYLAVAEDELGHDSLNVKVKRFEQTSSTKLELQTLLWALSDIPVFEGKIIVYTDSQNIVGLLGRRERLERNNYRSSKDKLLNNYELYREYYRITDQFNCEFIKVHGHVVSSQKDRIDSLFTIVDKASRKALRGKSI